MVPRGKRLGTFGLPLENQVRGEKMEYVTCDACESMRGKINDRLNRGDVRFERLETKLDTLIVTNRLIAGSIIGGVVTIIVTLLLRGI